MNDRCKALAAGLNLEMPDSYEPEGFDRKHTDLPACQNEVIRAVAKTPPNTVVILHNGSPVTMPWLKETAAVLVEFEALGPAPVI